MSMLFEKIDKWVTEFEKNYQKRKKAVKEWIKKECDFKFPNWAKVLLAALISFFIFRFFYELQVDFLENKPAENKDKIPMSFWTLATLLISSPVAFIIWHFRDQNVKEQIENQRKDINLKEFQKIAEWVSGLHLVENEITEKETKESDDIKSEKTTKYTQPDESRSIPTFSKIDGAVGLQIAAIHNLLPFFQGKHGDDFRRPALNLLTSAWLSLQQKDLLELEKLDVLKQKNEFEAQIKKIQKRANSPVGVALTQVLLSDGGDNLLKFPEVFPNLCLAGMDFHLPGLNERVLDLFKHIKNCRGINLIGANLYSMSFINIDLTKANFKGANLYESKFEYVNLNDGSLEGSNLSFSNIKFSNLRESRLVGTALYSASLNGVDLIDVQFINNQLAKANFTGSIISERDIDKNSLEDIKNRGGVILYENIYLQFKKENDDISINLIKLILKQDHKFVIYDSVYYIDLYKTREENPDWEISIEEIE